MMPEREDLPELAGLLSTLPFFESLPESSRLDVARQLEPVHLLAGELLFRQGDAADALYVVTSGRLRVTVESDGHERALYDLGRGAIVGELGLLTERPRSATIHAVRDCDLRRLGVEAFRSLIAANPGLARGVMRLLADRLLAVDQMLAVSGPRALPPDSRTIVVCVAGLNGRPAALVAEGLTERLGRVGSVLRLSSESVERELGEGSAQRRPGDPGRAELTEWLHAMEHANDHVVYEADAEDTAWSRTCLSQADVVLLVASADDDPALGPVERRALGTPSLRCELALLHNSSPSGTAAWRKSRTVADHHHLRAGHPEDIARMTRMITGTGCGLVLGGGGARGFAHLGVIRALEEAGIPIDIVGGTSFGALVAAAWARGMGDEERVSTFIRNGRRLLVTPTLPVVALSSGHRLDRLLESDLGETPIEDLPRGFFCVSASLNRAEIVIHDHGPLWSGVRASVSLPGVFPPVYEEGDLLVDGGTLDNEPVDVMRERIGHGYLIAVSVSTEVEPLLTAPYGPGLSGWRVFASRLNPFATRLPMPTVAEILTRSTVLSQVRHRATLDVDKVDLLLRPPVKALRVLDFKHAGPLIDSSYAYVAEMVAAAGLADRFAV